MLLIIQIALILILAAGVVGFFLQRFPTFAKFFSFSLLNISAILTIIVGIKILLTHQTLAWQIYTGFPMFHWQFLLDSLSGFFFIILGIIIVSISIYGPSYLQKYEKEGPIKMMTLYTSIFIFSMYLVLLANNVFSFIFSWELMSLSSYFLVVYNHKNPINRKAGLIYLLMAHASGLFILFAFGMLAKFSHSLNFDIIHLTQIPYFWANCIFASAFIGFGMKAGLMPLHIWLPSAHPVAPSHISALMSGVMLKIAVYGLLRTLFFLLRNVHLEWGCLILIFGTVSTLLGVLYALMQHDLKKLLAYHSIENIGIIFIGIGLSIIFLNNNHPTLAALGLIAALYHCFNHALFKSLLFLGAGTIQQATHEQDIEKMGGLIKQMPYTAFLFLIGCISISALPPFNGFVSEWLTFQTSLHITSINSHIIQFILPISAAILALTGALAATCFVKAYGIMFLGKMRTTNMLSAQDPKFSIIFSMGLLAFMCLIGGVFPITIINFINIVAYNMLGSNVTISNTWTWLVPIDPNSNGNSYAPLIVFIGILTIIYVTYLLTRNKKLNFSISKQSQNSQSKIWDCGFGKILPNMQYTATAFAMPIRRVFTGIWSVKESINVKDKEYNLEIEDWSWIYFYNKLDKYMNYIAEKAAYVQNGNIRVYLSYTFFTLLILLWLII